MDFEDYKVVAMRNLEEAKERKLVDKPIIPYLDLINSHKDFYTTSSCYGRITVDLVPFKENKKEHRWLGKWHRTVNVNEIKQVIVWEKGKVTWLKQDSFIIHIGVRDLATTEKFLDVVRNKAGLKRSGIMQLKPRIMIELIGLDTLAAPLFYEDKEVVKDYESLIKVANKKFKRNEERLKHFMMLFEKEFL